MRIDGYGDSEALSKELLGLIRGGQKRAGTGLVWSHEYENEAPGQVGDIEVVSVSTESAAQAAETVTARWTMRATKSQVIDHLEASRGQSRTPSEIGSANRLVNSAFRVVSLRRLLVPTSARFF